MVSFPNRNLGKTSDESRHLEGIRLDVRPNSLFLSASAQKNHPQLSTIYAYLTDTLEIIRGQDIPSLMMRTAETCSESGRRDHIAKLLEFADTGIHGLLLYQHEVTDRAKRELRSAFSRLKGENIEDSSPIWPADFASHSGIDPADFNVRFIHLGAEGRSYQLEGSQESDGTIAYFSILGPLLDSLRDGNVLMIDELETSLHPSLAREIVRLFNSPDLNPKGAQIIFTTHSTNLLDLELLRRDQIWFTEKSRNGATKLFSLTDYQPRTNQNIEAGYLGGRFGAIPYLDHQLLRESLITKDPPQASLKFAGEA